ncbi:hypothetical protein OGAPHI_001739 [Ogataea philodendri]|uniref:Uncharacterized protein n=1 Tax=Ogataea philodendri TaxID=1378263 RepID=A0A9P8T7B3_9ASCO|nr:uncharacterized protein OGAPHI_001739 [Ogataea philodendri]KAH3667985.1 hypothetical protein OGAPHI_001739 [Ogataea philodendri]
MASTSSDRLGKITGTVGSHLSTESSLAAEDPAVSDISQIVPSSTNETPEASMDNLLENLLKQGHNHHEPSILPDDFMKTMSSMLPADPDGKPSQTAHEQPKQPSEQEIYHNEVEKFKLRRFRAVFTAIRLVSVLLLVRLKLVGSELFYPSFERLEGGYGTHSLWNWFTILELAFSALPGPLYANAVYSSTKVAPALANSIASFPELIPPQPIRTRFESLVCFLSSLNAFNEISFNGLPERPPVWLTNAWSAVISRSRGLWIVVLDRTMPSILASLADLAIDSISGSVRSGATFTSTGGLDCGSSNLPGSLFLSATTLVSRLVSFDSFCKSRSPGVFGDETLITSTSAYSPNR